MNSAGDSIFKNKKNTEPVEDISLRGKTARHLVKVANHLPVVGPLRVNGQLQKKREMSLTEETDTLSFSFTGAAITESFIIHTGQSLPIITS